MSSPLQHKLLQFEATPPKEAWPAIEDRLNQAAIQERLLNFEATPPASAWNAIEASLDYTLIEKRKGKSFTKQNWFQYAAAAAILGIIALGILTISIQKPDSTIARQPLLKQEPATPATTKPARTTGLSNHNDEVETITPIKEESISIPVSSSKSQTATMTKRYTVVAKEDGQVVRLSQKAYAVFDCAVKGAAYRSEDCKENIQTMQAKMATSMVSPTTDFAGLIDMIKTLEENK